MLTDTNILVALIDDQDQYHEQLHRHTIASPAEGLTTTCYCFSEALYLLGASGGYRHQSVLLSLVSQGLLEIHHLTLQQEFRAAALLEQYQDRPMDYADASLIAVAESRQITQILTFDSDFLFYRLQDGSTLEIRP